MEEPSALKEVLRLTVCSDNPLGQLSCDLRSGYFSFVSEPDWKKYKLNLLKLPQELRFIGMHPWNIVMVPSEGWDAAAKRELPFNPPGALIVCPTHALVRLRKLVRDDKEGDCESLSRALRSAFGPERSGELAESLLSSDPSRQGDRQPVALIKQSFWRNGSSLESRSEANLRQLKKLGGSPEELARLWELVSAAQTGGSGSLGARRRRMDESLSLAWELAQRGGRSKAASYRILGEGFYWLFLSVMDVRGREEEMKITDHKLAIQRSIERVKQRLRRLRRSVAGDRQKNRKRRGRSFKKRRSGSARNM